MINLNILQFTKSYCLMLIMMSIVGVGSFSACNKKSKIDSNQPPNATEQFFTLKVTKTGTGSVSASWYSGKVTDAQIVQIPKGAKVILTAIDQSGYTTTNAIWNNTTKSDIYEFTMDADKSVDVNIVSQYLLTVSKTGKGIVTASWTGGSATDAQLSAGVWIDENTKVTFTATPDPTTPNVVWNGTIVDNTFPLTITNYSPYVSVLFTATPTTFFALNITDPSWKEGTITAYSDANRTMSITSLTQIAKDATVYIKVVPEKGKKVTQLIGIDAGSANSDNTEAVVTMTSPKQLSALFETLTYKLTLDAGTGGTIQAFTDVARTIPVADLNKIPYGTAVYLKIIPNPDWEYSISTLSGQNEWERFPSWPTYSRYMDDNHTISATFFSAFGFTETATTATLTDYYGSSTNVTILPTYNGKPVIAIGQSGRVFSLAVQSVTIPNSVTSIGNYAFAGCSGITSITIPNSVTSIGDGAFYGCSGLTGTLTIPNSVTSIGDEAFYDCEKLTGSINMPNITSIGNRAFSSCIGLTSVTIGNKVNYIGAGAFYNCYQIRSITVQATIPPTLGARVFVFVGGTLPYLNIYVPSGYATTYKNATEWNGYSRIIY